MFELEFLFIIYDLYFQAMGLLATAWAVSVTGLGWTILIWFGSGGRADPGRDEGMNDFLKRGLEEMQRESARFEEEHAKVEQEIKDFKERMKRKPWQLLDRR